MCWKSFCFCLLVLTVRGGGAGGGGGGGLLGEYKINGFCFSLLQIWTRQVCPSVRQSVCLCVRLSVPYLADALYTHAG